MPDFVLHRNHALRSTKGHMINFRKGIPQYVPPELIHDAVAIGAIAVDGKDYDPLGPEAVEKTELSVDQRKEALFKAFAIMEKRDVRGDFTAQGIPNLKSLEKLTGFLPDNKERNEAWMTYQESKTE